MRNIRKKPRTGKRVKGMTLVECIIALFVLSVMGVIMAQIGASVSKMMMNTNHVNNKVAAEAPYGAVRDVAGIQSIVGDYAADPTNAGTVSDGATNVSISVGSYGSVPRVRYSTAAAARKASDSGINCNTNANADLQFYVVPETTQPTT